jgi:hypothetical protein
VKIIESAWVDYRDKVIPWTAPAIQVTEMKRAFYAGAACLLDAQCKILGPGREPTDSDLLIMNGIQTELEQHASDVLGGKA